MTYAKLINNELVLAPNPIIIGDRQIGNPPGSVYEEQGYKPVVYTDPPSDPPTGFQWVERWSEGDGNIVQGWVLEQLPITEEEALTRYANELTGAEDETLTDATETLIKKVMEE